MAKTAGIMVIGNEILSGKVVDTNSPYMCQELRTLGVDVRRIVVVPDEIEVIARDIVAFACAFDYVFTRGGAHARRRDHRSDCAWPATASGDSSRAGCPVAATLG